MFRRSLLACTVLAFALSGCGRAATTMATGMTASGSTAQSLLHFKRPSDRLLPAGEQNLDFDHGLALASQEAIGWDKTSKLTTALHFPSHPRRDGSASVPRTSYTFTAGIDQLSVAVAPTTMSFDQDLRFLLSLVAGPIDTTKLVPYAQAYTAATAAGKIKTAEPFVALYRLHISKAAIYYLSDTPFAPDSARAIAAGQEKPGKACVDAYTGKIIEDKNTKAEAAQSEADLASLDQ